MSDYKVFIPKSLDKDYNNMYELIEQLSNIDALLLEGDEVTLYFEKSRWIDAEMTVFLGMICDHLMKRGVRPFAVLDNMALKTKELLKKNGFLTQFGIEEYVKDEYNTTIKFFKSRIANEDDEERINEYIYSELFRSIKEKTSDEFLNEINASIWEIIHNVIDHSQSNYLYMCGQFYPQKRYGTENGKISFAISDIGIGLLKNIKTRTNIVENKKAFDWAFEKGTSTKENIDGGVGLFEIKNKLRDKGEILVVSNEGYYNLNKEGKEQYYPFPFVVSGTLVIITLYLDDCVNNDIENRSIEMDGEAFNLLF